MSTLSALKEKLSAVPALVLAVFPALLFFPSCEQPAAGLGTRVDLTAPVLQINGELGPAPGSYVSGETRLYINASDDSGIEKVQLTYTYSIAGENNQLIGQDPVTVPARLDGETGLYYVDIDTAGMADGSLQVEVSATDSSGKATVSDKLIYTVKNAPPVIEFQIPRPQVTGSTLNNTLSPGASSHQVVINSFISGMFQDLAGVAPGYPQIRFWLDTSGVTPPPTHDRDNAGYGDVTASDGSDDGWIPVDQGLVVSEQGERGNAFRYYLRKHRLDGTYPGDADPIEQINTGFYSLQIRAKDIMGKEIQWPGDAYDGTKDRLSLEIYAPNTLPSVELSADPDNLYQRTDFTVTATAEPRGDVDTAISSLSIEVSGRKKGGTETGPVILAKWDGYDPKPSLDFNVIAGKSYYLASNGTTTGPVDETSVPSGAYYVTFGDGSYAFTARTRSNTNAQNNNEVNIYIDTQPPAVSVNSVTPYFSQDNPAAAVDSPNTTPHPPATLADSYRRWTVNSTVKIQVSSTDNRGNALDENGNMKFKYLLSKDNDIAETDYTTWLFGNPGKTFGDYLYQRADAVLFDATKAVSTPPNTSGQYDGPSYPGINVSGADGAYELNLKTHEWEGGGDYRVWFYIVSQDNAGNINYDKILLNVNQETDNPTVNFTTINNDGTSFVDENDPFRITLTDDDGLDPGAVEYRFSRDYKDNADDDDDDWSGWFLFPAFTGADGLSQDGRSIEISSLDLRKIYKDLTGIEYNSAPASGLNSIEDILGDESADKKIEIRAKDKLDTKIYTSASGDGVKTNTVQSAVFRMDLNAPRIVPTTTGITGTPFTENDPERNDNNPFGAPCQEESFSSPPVFYGDINELNPATLSFTVNETTVDFPVTILDTEPAGKLTAVWGSAPDIRWRFDTTDINETPLWDNLAEGAHTFRLEVRDKAGRSAVKQVTFFKDSEGPAINFITINGISLLDEELEDIRDGNSWTTISAEEKYNEIKGGAVIRETDAKIFGSFVDGYSTVDPNFWYCLDGGFDDEENWNWVLEPTSTNGKTANWAVDLSALLDGFHTLNIRVKDSSGNGYVNEPDGNSLPSNGPGAAVNIGFILDKEYPRLVIVSPYGDKDTDETVYAYRTIGEAPGTTALTVKGLAGDSSLKSGDPLIAGVDGDTLPNNAHVTTQVLNWRGESLMAPDTPGQWDAYRNTDDNTYYFHNGTGWEELGPVNLANIYDPDSGEVTILWTYTLTVSDLNAAVGGEGSTQDGSHKVTFTVQEEASPRTTTRVWNFVRDNAPPVINIISGSPGNNETNPAIIMGDPKIQGT
ncbi:MAG: hypothetical protein LBK02_04505, partial [Treponema sp.]|nr:hypothetical protein [Treponema sp.]